MKYLKTFEDIEYEIGDYVKLKYIPIDATYYGKIDNVEENRFVQIIHSLRKNSNQLFMFNILKITKNFLQIHYVLIEN